MLPFMIGWLIGGGVAIIALATNLANAGWKKGALFEAFLKRANPEVRPEHEKWTTSWD